MSAKMLEASLLGAGAVLRLERDACSMVKRKRQATKYVRVPPFPPSPQLIRDGIEELKISHPPCSVVVPRHHHCLHLLCFSVPACLPPVNPPPQKRK